MLCFEHPEAIHSTVSRMSEVIEALGYESNGDLVKRDYQNEGKKRRL